MILKYDVCFNDEVIVVVVVVVINVGVTATASASAAVVIPAASKLYTYLPTRLNKAEKL